MTASLLLFVAIVTPFELGFLETNINTTEGITLFAVNRFVDLVFTIDILVQMNTMYFDPKGRKVYSRKRIFAHYARTWLFVDVISILPFELILFLLNEHSVDQSQARLKAIRFIRLLRLLKLLRVLRGLRIFARWEARLTLNHALLSLQKYFSDPPHRRALVGVHSDADPPAPLPRLRGGRTSPPTDAPFSTTTWTGAW